MSDTNDQHYGKVAVLMGGDSGEREISLKSGAAVLKALLKNNIDAHGIDVDKNIYELLQKGKFDRAFIALHGCGGEDGTMQGGLEVIKLPYTGSGVMASGICMDKLMTKTIWQSADIQSPRYIELTEQAGFEDVSSELGVPFVVKPSLEGSSLGIHKVSSQDEFQVATEDASHFQGHLMAEQWIQGQEFTVSILNDMALPVIRLETPHTFYDFAAKYQTDDTQYILPCGLSANEEAKLQQQALTAFHATGASGWGRVDVMMDENMQSWFLEVNTVPGMTDHSLVPMAAAANGIDFDALVLKILDTSYE